MMLRFLTVGLASVWLLLTLAAPVAAQKPARFAALLSNGERLEGQRLTHWHNNGANPLLEGKPLLDPGKPLRWLRDRAQLPGPAPRAFLEMHSGDRLPGMVVDYISANSESFAAQPAHFRVRPEFEVRLPAKNSDPDLRIVASFVRRIVWQKRDRQEFEPNTIFFRDGRALPFRAVRFGSSFANVLLADGNRRIPFVEMAEIHLPAVDPWQAYFDELAVLAADDPDARLYQIETTEGLVLTGSYQRRQTSAFGSDQDFDRWVHGLQPAWSLDVVYVPTTHIWARRMWRTHEVPLSRIWPSQIVTRSPLSAAGRAPRVNTNVDGGPLRSGSLDFGWGFGVHAHTELTFALPLGVRALRGSIALDRSAGKGGCIRARVFANDTSAAPLWESPYLVGSETVADLGTIALVGPAQGQKAIVLQVDAAHAGRPANADPLDVRDMADWLDPWLELDPDVVKAEVAKRSEKLFAAWQDWDVALHQDGQIAWQTYWNEIHRAPGNYRQGIAARQQPLTLTRELKLSPGDNWLVVFANRSSSSGPPPKLEVRIGGEAVAEYDVPHRHRGNEDQPPLAVRLTNYHAAQQPIQVEIRQQVSKDGGYVDYRAIEVVSQLPHLNQIFEDQGEFAAADAEQTGTAKLVTDDRHYGAQAVQITPGGRFRLKLPQPLAIREHPQWGEYRHIRFALRKTGEGRAAIELNHDGEFDRPARYDAGTGEPVGKSAKRLWNSALPNQWIVLTRDLYADYGSFDATGITLEVPDGEHALFDHIYLARRPEDFNQIPNAPPPELVNQKARRDLAKPILEHVTPAVVMLQMADGRLGSGVCISREGEILTAGHVVAAPNQECTVHLSDGRAVKAQTRGIWRDFDIGLVKITEPGEYKHINRGEAREIPENQFYVGFVHANKLEKGAPPSINILGIRRVFRGMIWTDFDVADFAAGGPLIDRNWHVIGIQTKRSEFGGLLFSRLENFDAQLGRLRNGNVYGNWFPGLGPDFGFQAQATREGAKLSSVAADGPAARAGLKVGDIVTKVDGRPVVSLEDIYAILAEKNPGQDCTVDYFRSGQMLQAKIVLAPRAP